MQTPLMSARRRRRLTISQENDLTLISLGNMEIWDGVDLSLIRDTLFEQVLDFGHRDFALDLTSVKYIPSGFFGMLGEWKDRGINITILGVQPNVAQMLWFQQYFTEFRPGYFCLEAEPKFLMDTAFDDDVETDASSQEMAVELMTTEEWTDCAGMVEEAIAY